jgi:hypothetical protein
MNILLLWDNAHNFADTDKQHAAVLNSYQTQLHSMCFHHRRTTVLRVCGCSFLVSPSLHNHNVL